jgi:hypothetical protein
MNESERNGIIQRMGETIGTINQAMKGGDRRTAQSAFVTFMAAAGVLAMEIDELDNTDAN